MCDLLFPILKPHARVVNLSSLAGALAWVSNKELKAKLSSKSLTTPELDELMTAYIDAANKGTLRELGWDLIQSNWIGLSVYSVSKVAVSALSIIQQRNFDKFGPGNDFVVNFVNPGYVSTEMTGYKGDLSIDEGAKSAVYAATLPKATNIKGKFIGEDCSVLDWTSEEFGP